MVIESEDYCGPERRRMPLSEEQIEEIAERAAARAVERMTNMAYTAIGKGVVNKFLWVIGLVAVGLASWMHGKGLLDITALFNKHGG